MHEHIVAIDEGKGIDVNLNKELGHQEEEEKLAFGEIVTKPLKDIRVKGR
jgi:hypothetical protein